MIEDIQSMITAVGFPIAVTLYLLWERRQREVSDSENIKQAINNNTKALTELIVLVKNCRRD